MARLENHEHVISLTMRERKLLAQVLEQYAYDFQGRMELDTEERLARLQDEAREIQDVWQVVSTRGDRLNPCNTYAVARSTANALQVMEPLHSDVQYDVEYIGEK